MASSGVSSGGPLKLKFKLGGPNSHGVHPASGSPTAGSDGGFQSPTAASFPSPTLPPIASTSAVKLDDEDDAASSRLSSQFEDKDDVDMDGDYADEPPNNNVQDASRRASVFSASPNTAQFDLSSVQQPAQSVSAVGSIGNIVVPGTAPKKRKSKAAGPLLDASGAPLPDGRGWRKGMKGYQKPDGTATGGSTSMTQARRKRKMVSLADDEGDAYDDGNDEFTPSSAGPSGTAASEKWANGLPGGNEQSRITGAMASAVNKQFPVGQPPKTGTGFLTSLPLDKKAPRPRSWIKAKREIVGPNGVVFSLPVWVGDNNSPYTAHMATHPRPPPVVKKVAASELSRDASLSRAGSPHDVLDPESTVTGGNSLAPPAKGRAKAAVATGAGAGRAKAKRAPRTKTAAIKASSLALEPVQLMSIAKAPIPQAVSVEAAMKPEAVEQAMPAVEATAPT